MASSVQSLSNDTGFMPHGMCYLWQPDLLGMHVISDLAISDCCSLLLEEGLPFTIHTLPRYCTCPNHSGLPKL